MAFVDEITLFACAGNGGDGVVRWHHERGKPKGGPSGGNGGRGGNIVVRGVRDLALLARYRGVPDFRAAHGKPGGKQNLYGADGEDTIIDIPVGSIITLEKKGTRIELLNENEKHIILSGGRGGLGNAHFKSSRNVTPMQSTSGAVGECDTLNVELQLIADAGLVGFPNAGKSTLLNSITNAQAKTGDYAFTTLEPNLGSLYGYIIADIPGLIEGASEGKGLGHQFLRHIRRTKALIICISDIRDTVVEPYNAILQELEAFDTTLLKVPRFGLITKADLFTKEVLQTHITELEKHCAVAMAVSVYDDQALKKFQDTLITFLREHG